MPVKSMAIQLENPGNRLLQCPGQPLRQPGRLYPPKPVRAVPAGVGGGT